MCSSIIWTKPWNRPKSTIRKKYGQSRDLKAINGNSVLARSALGSPFGRAGTRSVTERVPAAAGNSPRHCVALPPHKCGGQGLSFCCTSHPGDSTRGIPFGLTPVTSIWEIPIYGPMPCPSMRSFMPFTSFPVRRSKVRVRRYPVPTVTAETVRAARAKAGKK